jgi:hypothetical protein
MAHLHRGLPADIRIRVQRATIDTMWSIADPQQRFDCLAALIAIQA